VPSSTVVTTVFLTHARMAAKNLQLEALPLIVTPHPLNDLTPDEMKALARSAYPLVIRQLTSQAPLEKEMRVAFVHPAQDRVKTGTPLRKEGA
jgi:hypothetical protein